MTTRILRPGQWSIRLRLTALYALLFVVAGAVLLSANYAAVRGTLPDNRVSVVIRPDSVAAARKILADPTSKLSPEERNLAEKIVHAPPALLKQLLAQNVQLALNGKKGTAAFIEKVTKGSRGRTLSKLLDTSLLILAVIALCSIGLGWWLAGRVLRPVKRITTKARNLTADNLHERIALRGPHDELKELADTFDAMLDRLDTAFAAQRRFVADASHELRTPLAIMRTELDVTLADPDATADELRQMGSITRDAVDRTARLVDGLLTLVVTDRGLDAVEPVDLAVVAGDAVAGLQREASDQSLALSAALSPAHVEGNPALVQRLIENLLENAIRHNTPGGWITIVTDTDTDSTEAKLVVSSSGPVIADDRVDELFEPFHRGDRIHPNRNAGVGLGLAIVRSIANAHHGNVRATAIDGGGLRVEVRIRLATSGLVGSDIDQRLGTR